MYERFTDRARKVMQLANREAQRFNHEYIGTEHVLLGLVAEGSGVAANVLKNLDIDLGKVRLEVEPILQHGPGGEEVVKGRLPQTPRTKKVIEYAIAEARGLHHNYVGTEHLLLGLLREQEGVAAQVLMNLGLKLEDVRVEVLNLLGPLLPKDGPSGEPEVVKLDKSLNPAKVEGYTVSDLWSDDDTPAAPTKPEPLTDEQLAAIRELVRQLTEQKDAATEAQDFERAARLREEGTALKTLLAWYEWARGRA